MHVLICPPDQESDLDFHGADEYDSDDEEKLSWPDGTDLDDDEDEE